MRVHCCHFHFACSLSFFNFILQDKLHSQFELNYEVDSFTPVNKQIEFGER
jgi:hypothetical protein